MREVGEVQSHWVSYGAPHVGPACKQAAKPQVGEISIPPAFPDARIPDPEIASAQATPSCLLFVTVNRVRFVVPLAGTLLIKMPPHPAAPAIPGPLPEIVELEISNAELSMEIPPFAQLSTKTESILSVEFVSATNPTSNELR
jgi:hypothetical protein